MEKDLSKSGFHLRNKHRQGYDFDALLAVMPSLKTFIQKNKIGNDSIDFANPAAVKALNKALLAKDYGIFHWDIPANYLCPPIPSRAEYLHHIADVLGEDNQGNIPMGATMRVMDIGVGANCIYPIIGHQEYGWNFIGTDIDKVSLQSAEKIVAENEVLKTSLSFRLQAKKECIFKNIIQPNEYYEMTLCNPPFHPSAEAATAANQRKVRNLGKREQILNFGGQATELWCEGGEMEFIARMILESAEFKSRILWFSTLVSKSENLKNIEILLTKVAALEVKKIELSIGNKISRLVFWTFLNKSKREHWMQKRGERVV